MVGSERPDTELRAKFKVCSDVLVFYDGEFVSFYFFNKIKAGMVAMLLL